jgi:hypothetical protein
MAEVTFRDFAAAVMQKDQARAAEVLTELLGVDTTRATAAASHFAAQMSTQGQPFMMKAMGLRAAVTSGSDDEIGALLRECFGLDGETTATAVTALRRRYPAAQ